MSLVWAFVPNAFGAHTMKMMIAMLVASVGLAGLVVAQESKPAPSTPAATPATPATPAAQPATPAAPAAKPAEGAKAEETVAYEYVVLETSKGNITLELNATKAPLSTANFLKYVDKGHYNGTIFHRVINNFMIQGGGFNRDMIQKATEAPIKNEWQNGLKNVRGSIAMARTNVPDSATSQFYINVVDNASLDRPRDGAAYAVFGKVVAGMDVVDAIKEVQTGVNAKTRMPDVPVETVEIKLAKKISADEAKKVMEPAKAPEAKPAATPEASKAEPEKK
jgi:cyclophilin family peptidyl-prolyl cis-trans isomerase